MNVIDILMQPTIEQLQSIYDERKKINSDFGKAAIKARRAAAYLGKGTWSLHCLSYVNALLLGSKRAKLEDSYVIMVLLSTVESFSFAQTGMTGLTFVEYNTAIGPIASTLQPELFQEEQNWQIEKIPQVVYPSPYYPAGAYPKTRNAKQIDLDPYSELEGTGLTSKDLQRAIAQLARLDIPEPEPKITSNASSAIERMKAKMRGEHPGEIQLDYGAVSDVASASARMLMRMRDKIRTARQT